MGCAVSVLVSSDDGQFFLFHNLFPFTILHILHIPTFCSLQMPLFHNLNAILPGGTVAVTVRVEIANVLKCNLKFPSTF